jgi:hypothetical protein
MRGLDNDGVRRHQLAARAVTGATLRSLPSQWQTSLQVARPFLERTPLERVPEDLPRDLRDSRALRTGPFHEGLPQTFVRCGLQCRTHMYMPNRRVGRVHVATPESPSGDAGLRAPSTPRQGYSTTHSDADSPKWPERAAPWGIDHPERCGFPNATRARRAVGNRRAPAMQIPHSGPRSANSTTPPIPPETLLRLIVRPLSVSVPAPVSRSASRCGGASMSG